MNIHDYKDTGQNLDLSDTIVHVCICGSKMFRIVATFDNFEIAQYSTDGECLECGTRVKVPTPIDNPDYDPYE